MFSNTSQASQPALPVFRIKSPLRILLTLVLHSYFIVRRYEGLGAFWGFLSVHLVRYYLEATTCQQQFCQLNPASSQLCSRSSVALHYSPS